MFRGAKLLTDKLVNLFGVDAENKEYYNSEKDDLIYLKSLKMTH